eukprot:scaffold840_cov344-Pavlova_lutheri.AAC.26
MPMWHGTRPRLGSPFKRLGGSQGPTRLERTDRREVHPRSPFPSPEDLPGPEPSPDRTQEGEGRLTSFEFIEGCRRGHIRIGWRLRPWRTASPTKQTPPCAPPRSIFAFLDHVGDGRDASRASRRAEAKKRNCSDLRRTPNGKGNPPRKRPFRCSMLAWTPKTS